MLKNSKKRILSVLLALTLLLLPQAGLSVFAEEESDAAIGQSDDAVLPVADSLEIGMFSTQLPTPQNLAWGPNGTAEWDKVQNAEGEYIVRLYKDGQEVDYAHWHGVLGEHISIEMTPEMNASGTYYFTVEAVGRNGFTNSGVATSGTYTYNKPNQSLGVPTNLQWKVDNDAIMATWDTPANADPNDTYYVQLYRDGRKHTAVWGFTDNQIDFDSEHDINGDGTYTFTVRAISSRIEQMANSPESAPSPEYLFGGVIAGIKDKLNNILEDLTSGGSISDALTVVKDLMTSELASAMQADKGVLNSIKDLEDRYKAAENITVSSSVASDISDRLDASKISVVGAALNAQGANQQMSLNFKKPDEEQVIDESQYKNWVQFSIDLDGTADSSRLEVPVQITMPIPTGVFAERLVILHYHQDGSYETIWPSINGDGTATFTVTSFSTFVFANEVEDAVVRNNSGSGSSGGSSSADRASTTSEEQRWTDFSRGISAAVKEAKTNGKDYASIRIQNAEELTVQRNKEIINAAKAAGGKVRIYADSTVDGKLEVRLSIDPSQVSKDIKLRATIGTTNTKSKFEKFYSNKLAVISLEQQNAFGMPVDIAAKLDLAGMDTKTLYFYAYDRAANTYKRIMEPNYRIDTKGFLHFTTVLAGDILVTDKPLTKK